MFEGMAETLARALPDFEEDFFPMRTALLSMVNAE